MEWQISTTAVYAGITTFTMCFAVAAMVLAPFSELQGRRPVFLVAGVVYCISQIGSGATMSFVGMLVTRAIAGFSCSVFSTMVGGVISDIYISKERNTAMAIFSGTALAGAALGPMISGIIAQHLNWRWIFYLQTITCAITVFALFLGFPETRGSVLLSQKTQALNRWYEEVEKQPYHKPDENTGNEGRGTDVSIPVCHGLRWKVKEDEDRAFIAILIRISLTRPLFLLFAEGIVFWLSLWMAFAWTIVYPTFEALPLMFSATAVASILSAILAVWQESSLPRIEWLPGNLRDKPERRLYFSCFQSLLLPVGLFWLETTMRPSIPWIVPVLAFDCLTIGIFSVYLAVFNYLADTYHAYARSAIAAQSFTRNVFAACLPLATAPMFSDLGFLNAGCLLGAADIALSAVPWALVLWGEKIRRRSKIASQSAE
ncbi:MFS general substrate transporter [Microthyrium microscopicum]|uniref:MFS general substrate transporter n=1 Tax=Microthyrium microscopicum TaxID=703497 RepID=A0A6A6UJ97_9PEZI|nr:MFS general substrate transporter [Microthyrium microscopicum]